MKTIIGLVGEKLAGKDTVANYLTKRHNAFHIKFSKILDEILKLLDLPLSRRNEIDLGLGLRKIFGPEVLYLALKNRALQAKESLAVINGLRMDEQAKAIVELDAKIIYITAPAETRFQRYKNRHEKVDDAVMDFSQFQRQEREATEVGIPLLGAQANFRIDNVGSLAELYKKVDVIINQITR